MACKFIEACKPRGGLPYALHQGDIKRSSLQRDRSCIAEGEGVEVCGECMNEAE
jgi:hypothetical protein